MGVAGASPGGGYTAGKGVSGAGTSMDETRTAEAGPYMDSADRGAPEPRLETRMAAAGAVGAGVEACKRVAGAAGAHVENSMLGPDAAGAL